MSRTFWYLELEPLNARYTEQLCRQWFPSAFERAARMSGGYGWKFVVVHATGSAREIGVGKVLDATGRGRVALRQCEVMLDAVERGQVTSDDVIYLQDMWTPGLEAVLYALHQHGLRPRIYARCFAQSVDAYDFTYPMRSWMRPVELGWSRAMSGIFVASEVHREQLRAAGVECPVHVTGLPYRLGTVSDAAAQRENRVVYSSRLNAEKNPWFMLDVAEQFLRLHGDWTWVVTTSAKALTSELPGLLDAMRGLESDTDGRFTMLPGLAKAEYYSVLAHSRIQFNSALQDYVAFTMLEAADAGCDLCYPDFRSFPECVDPERRYAPFVAASALDVLGRCVASQRVHRRAPAVCDRGLDVEAAIMLQGWDRGEVNVWHQPPRFFAAEGLLA